MPRATTDVTVNGDALRKLRISRGIELADLSRATGIHRSHLSRLEVGSRTVCSLRTFEAILTALKAKSRRRELLATNESEAA